jgi:hypothetical protein
MARMEDKQQLLEELEHLALDHVAPDRETDADLVVLGGGLRLLVKLASSIEVAQRLLEASPDTDAVILVAPPRPFAGVVVDAYAGSPVRFESLGEALGALVTPVDVDWSGLPSSPVVDGSRLLTDPADAAAYARGAADDVRAAGRRAQGEVKKRVWQAVSDDDAAWVGSIVHRAASGVLGPRELESELEARGGAAA